MQHPELGRRILDRVADAVAHVGLVEIYPTQEGRNMTMMLSPGQATRRQREAALAHQATEAAAEELAAEAELEETEGVGDEESAVVETVTEGASLDDTESAVEANRANS